MELQSDTVVKLYIEGDFRVGKTCLLERFIDHSFDERYIPSIGVDFKRKTIKWNREAIKTVIIERLYSRYKWFPPAYYREADGIFIVYDVTDRNSYAQVPIYIANIHQHSKPSVVLLIIGNKSDLEAQRVVSFEEGKALADELNASFMETSARTSANIEAAFCSMAATIKARLEARALNYDGLRVSSKESADAKACY